MSRSLVLRDEHHYMETVAEVRALAERCEVVEDARHLAAYAAAAGEWARRAKLGIRKVNLATAAKLWAERRAGELLIEARENGQRETGFGVARRDSKTTLEDLGVDKHESHRWQHLAEIPAETFTEVIDGIVEHPDDEKTSGGPRRLSAAEVVRYAGRKERDDAKAHERDEAEAAARASGLTATIAIADIRSWRPEGVTCIVTDPPYITADAVELHSALADLAVDVLPSGGALAVMTWQPILPAVFEAMRRARLVYRWTAAWVFETTEQTPERGPRVFDGWKPVLVFHKDGWAEDVTYLRDIVRSPGTDKQSHKWGQNLDGFRQLVRAISTAGDVVCDPFVGGGTTAVAALAEARNFVGADIDAEAVATTRARLS